MRHKSRNRRRASASVELAVLLPFLIYLVMISVDWARLVYYTITINDCARAGAIWASDEELRMKSRYTTVTAAALAEAPEMKPSPTVTLKSGTYDGNPAAIVTVSTEFRTITSIPGVPASENITRTVRMRIAPMATR